MNRVRTDVTRAMMEARLAPDETLIWWDRPDPGAAFLRALPNLVFASVWWGVTVTWTGVLAATMGAAALIGLPFVLIGAALWFGAARKALAGYCAHYALTDRRILIVDVFPPSLTITLKGRAVRPVRHTGGPNRGDVLLGAAPNRRALRLRPRGGPIGVRLVAISEPERVASAIREALTPLKLVRP